ncbi:MAG: sulfotransferase [Myxococcales bacterium]|nr:sulfotransferase [Myxococcales bacterium]
MTDSATGEAPGIVILGAPRSGTTLLRRLLDAHASIACPPETFLLGAAARFLHEETFAHGLRIGVLLGLGYAGFDQGEVLGRLREFTFGFLRDHARAQGKPRWAEKTAFNAFHVPAIRRLCQGHVRFVCIHRHGLDVALSLEELVQKTGGYVDELHRYIRQYPEPLEAFARAWIDSAGALAQLAEDDEHALAIRYEDLTRDPEGTLRGVLDFLGEPWDDGLIERALGGTGGVGFGDWKTYGRATIDSSSVARWRGLPLPVRSKLAALCNPTLERLGYEPVPVIEARAGESDEDARRRYELGLMLNRMKRGKPKTKS